MEGGISENEIEPFSCIQPRRFVPQWKANETNKTGNVLKSPRPRCSSVAKNGDWP